MAPLLVVVGSGPGIGVATAAHFASNAFNIALISRNPTRLQEDVSKVQAVNSSVKVQAFPANVADSDALKKALETIHQSMGLPEVVLFNTARIAQTTIGETDVQEVLDDFKLMNIGQLITAYWAFPLLTQLAAQNKPGVHPTFLNSSSGVGNTPLPPLFSLCMQKAAQNNFLGSFAQVAGPKGVHIARVDINGVVRDEEPVLNAKNIAEQHWKLSRQGKEEWQDMIEVGSLTAFLNK